MDSFPRFTYTKGIKKGDIVNLSGSFAQNLMCVIIFVVTILIAQILARKFKLPKNIGRFLFAWHALFAVAYWQYSLGNPADAVRYYRDAFEPIPSFRPGTPFINYVVTPLVQVFDISYFGLYLIFHMAGLIGIYALYASLRKLTVNAPINTQYAALLCVVLPGINFWSAAPGKDSIFLMAVGLTIWAFVHTPVKKGTLIFAIALMAVIRPHVAAVFVLSIFIASLTTSQLSVIKKSLAMIVLAPVCFMAIQFALAFVNIEAAEIAGYVEGRQSLNQSGGGAIALESMSPPARMFAYVFRPFFDSLGVATLLITFEHILLLSILGWGAMNFRKVPSSIDPFPRRVFFICSIVMWIMFANTTANLGIALRQKWMFLPMLLVLAISYWPRKVR